MLSEQKLREEFEASKDLQIEFGDDFRAFFALKKHEDFVARKAERRDRRRARKAETTVDEPNLRAEFAASKNLQAEFRGNVETYLAFKRGEGKRMVMEREGSSLTSAAGQKKTEKKISGKEPVKNTQAQQTTPYNVPRVRLQAARRAKEIQEADELEQYRFGLPCDENGVVCS